MRRAVIADTSCEAAWRIVCAPVLAGRARGSTPATTSTSSSSSKSENSSSSVFGSWVIPSACLPSVSATTAMSAPRPSIPLTATDTRGFASSSKAVRTYGLSSSPTDSLRASIASLTTFATWTYRSGSAGTEPIRSGNWRMFPPVASPITNASTTSRTNSNLSAIPRASFPQPGRARPLRHPCE